MLAQKGKSLLNLCVLPTATSVVTSRSAIDDGTLLAFVDHCLSAFGRR
jgi:hypothetical protein